MGTDDITKMRNAVMDFPNLLTKLQLDQEVLDICENLRDRRLVRIAILGMGGSAIAGHYVKALLLDSTRQEVIVNQDYSLPAYIDAKWIAIAISYSGNTAETLAAYDEAARRGCRLLAITSDGKLLSEDRSLMKIRIPSGFQPRAAFPLIFSVVLNLVECLVGVKPSKLMDIADTLSERLIKWKTSSAAPKHMAQDLVGHIPVFIGARHLIPVAYRAKCQINENAKAMAFYSQIPEANHNELESFTTTTGSIILPIFLRSSFEDEIIGKRMDLTSSLYEEEGYSPIQLRIKNTSRIEEMLLLTFYLDLVSLELAQIRGANPAIVERINRLKMTLSD